MIKLVSYVVGSVYSNWIRFLSAPETPICLVPQLHRSHHERVTVESLYLILQEQCEFIPASHLSILKLCLMLVVS